MDNRGELGQRKNLDDYGLARQKLATLENESALKAARNYGGATYTPQLAVPGDVTHQHFGHLIVSCDKADLKPTATGIAIYADHQKSFEALPAPGIPRMEVIDELVAAVLHDQQPVHSGTWARATTAVCLAMLESAALKRDCVPGHQIRAI